jgi:hypothetical protein
MKSPIELLLTALVVIAALSGCSSPGPPETPLAGSRGSGSASAGSASSQSVNAKGKVAGQILYVGGPAPGAPRALKRGGTVVFTGALTFKAPVHSHGVFSVRLSPGTYSITATSPVYHGGRGVCAAQRRVRVTDGSSASVKIYCQIR